MGTPKEEADPRPNTTNTTQADASLPALDGGWAWMIVLGAGLVWAIVAGFWASYTLIYQELLHRFGGTHTATALLSSINGGLAMFSGPLAGALSVKFGHRYVVIAGGLCCSAGLAMSGFAPTLSTMYFSYGIVVGLGFGLCLTPTFALIPIYFNKRRGIAMALSTITMGFAAVIVPFVMWLLSEYGYSGTMLIYGALFLNLCITGGLYRPLKQNYPKGKSMQTKYNDVNEMRSVKYKPQFHDLDTRLTSSLTSLSKCKQTLRNARSEDLFGSLQNIHLHTYSSNSSIPIQKSPHNTDTEIQCSKPLKKEEEETAKNCCNSWLKNWFNLCDVALLKHKRYIFFTISVTGMYFVNNIASIFMSGVAAEKGFDRDDIRLLLISINICDAVSRLVSGILLDCSFARKHFVLIHTLVAILTCICQVVIAICSNKILLFVAWNCYQSGVATHHAQQPNALSDIVGPERVTSAIGLMRLINGIALVMSPIIGGSLKDLTNQYMWCYLVASFVGLLTSAIFLIYNQCSQNKICQNITFEESCHENDDLKHDQ